ncbi:hypothetical protein V474_14605 [Novosphingobium barchaimii LL02]|uniref:Cyclic GMP-AMP synthase n=1 Tax=Novosphingobium barchaimii LL02 TaxID=1114963 RepID=A0A0J8ANX0_9SPHN|nr:nucleotidyltransferase [Novosphingobium barchaimii]KMS56195.1 hypothetical protein V474_14605 [Novosphingobium barchaimii LL02]
MVTKATATAQEYLEALADELAVSEARYEQAERSYHSLGDWLNRDASTIAQYSPAVYVQGSFGLGTVIKPIKADAEYDIDAVCELKDLTKAQLTQRELKILVGREIEAYRVSKGMHQPLEERRRCWTLRYADGAQFHMDVVPALPDGAAMRAVLEARFLDAQWADPAIGITDNEHHLYDLVTQDWPHSNPKGYLRWFKSRMEVIQRRRKQILADSIRASVESIPDYKVRTPLQSAIMILKRHRDIMYVNDEINCCPISIIITTLAGHAYDGEEQIADALLSILSRMDQFIERVNGQAYIQNPSDPLENFADKWATFPERERAFYEWLAQARHDFATAAQQVTRTRITDTLSPHLGAELAKRAEERTTTTSGLLRPATAAVAAAAAANAPHSFGNTARKPTKPAGFA